MQKMPSRHLKTVNPDSTDEAPNNGTSHVECSTPTPTPNKAPCPRAPFLSLASWHESHRDGEIFPVSVSGRAHKKGATTRSWLGQEAFRVWGTRLMALTDTRDHGLCVDRLRSDHAVQTLRCLPLVRPLGGLVTCFLSLSLSLSLSHPTSLPYRRGNDESSGPRCSSPGAPGKEDKTRRMRCRHTNRPPATSADRGSTFFSFLQGPHRSQRARKLFGMSIE